MSQLLVWRSVFCYCFVILGVAVQNQNPINDLEELCNTVVHMELCSKVK